MRILLTTDTVGGVWTFTEGLTAELLERGHTVALVSFGRTPSEWQTSWVKATQACHPATFRYQSSTSTLEWMTDNAESYSDGASLLLRIEEEFRPDIFHSNQFCFGKLPVACPRVITAHSDVLSWGQACRPDGLASSAWLDRYILLVQSGLDHADAVVSPTAWMLNALEQNFHTPALTHVVPNGLNLTPVYSEDIRLQAVTAGRLWDEAKDVAVLAEVDTDLPLLLAGESTHQSSSAPATLGNVQVLGMLPRYDLLELFRRSAVYIATSIYEPFGLAPLEAARCGCAIVARDIPSLREVWRDAALYFVDAGSLSAHLNDLAASPEWLLAARQRACQRASEFTSERMTAGYVAVYEDLLETRLSGGSYATEEALTYVS